MHNGVYYIVSKAEYYGTLKNHNICQKLLPKPSYFSRTFRHEGNMRVLTAKGSVWNAPLAIINLAITRCEQTILVLLSSEMLTPR